MVEKVKNINLKLAKDLKLFIFIKICTIISSQGSDNVWKKYFIFLPKIGVIF